MKRQRSTVAILSLLLLVLLVACGDDDDSAAPAVTSGANGESGECADFEDPSSGVTGTEIKVGAVIDLTGPTSAQVVPMYEGAKAYYEMVNEQGGINGRQVRYLAEDHHFDTQAAVAGYNKLVRDERVLGMSIGGGLAVGALAEQVTDDEIPVVGMGQTVDLQLGHPFWFNTNTHFADQADIAAAIMAEMVGDEPLRVGVFVHDGPSGAEWATYMDDAVAAEGGEITASEVSAIAATNVDSQARRIIDSGANIVTVNHGSTPLPAFLTAIERFGGDQILAIVGTTNQGDRAVWEAVSPEIGERFYFVHMEDYSWPSEDNQTPGAVELREHLGSRVDQFAGTTFITGWIDAMVMAEGIERAGCELTRASLKTGLESIDDMDTGGLTGPLAYDECDHYGLEGMRLFTWEYEDASFVGEGEFDDYVDEITNRHNAELLNRLC